jgi:hypothetical protein
MNVGLSFQKVASALARAFKAVVVFCEKLMGLVSGGVNQRVREELTDRKRQKGRDGIYASTSQDEPRDRGGDRGSGHRSSRDRPRDSDRGRDNDRGSGRDREKDKSARNG